jgi:hypothetical protein
MAISELYRLDIIERKEDGAYWIKDIELVHIYRDYFEDFSKTFINEILDRILSLIFVVTFCKHIVLYFAFSLKLYELSKVRLLKGKVFPLSFIPYLYKHKTRPA